MARLSALPLVLFITLSFAAHGDVEKHLRDAKSINRLVYLSRTEADAVTKYLENHGLELSSEELKKIDLENLTKSSKPFVGVLLERISEAALEYPGVVTTLVGKVPAFVSAVTRDMATRPQRYKEYLAKEKTGVRRVVELKIGQGVELLALLPSIASNEARWELARGVSRHHRYGSNLWTSSLIGAELENLFTSPDSVLHQIAVFLVLKHPHVSWGDGPD